MLEIPVSPGEVADRITILRIKSARLGDPDERAFAQLRSLELEKRLQLPKHLEGHLESLQSINEALWEAEDRVRSLDAAGSFGEEFTGVARSIYRLNDERHAIKKALDGALGFQTEGKSLPDY